MKKIRENIIKYGSLLLIFALPLVSVTNIVSPFISTKTFFFYGLVDLIFVFWIYNLFIDNSYRLSKKQLYFFIPPFLYIIWISIAGILAVNPHLAFWSSFARGTGILTYYHALAFSFIVASLVKKEGLLFINNIVKSIVSSSFILAISVWLGTEGFKLPYTIFKGNGGGFMDNSSFAAAYIIFPLFFCFCLLFSKSISKNWKIFTSITIATIIFSPLFINLYGLFTGSGLLGSARGALLGILIGLGVITLVYLSLSKNKAIKIFGVASILISLTVFSIGWSQLMKPGTYLHEKFTEVASNGTRFIFWDIAQKTMNENPYFGYGPENYVISFQENFDPQILNKEYGVEAWNDKAHNIYFETGVSGGYPAIALYILFFISIFYAIYRAYIKGNLSRFQASILCGLLVAYLFQNLFIFDSPVTFMVLFMISGLVYSLQDQEIRKVEKIKIGEITQFVIAATLLIVFVVSFVNLSYLPLKKSRDFMRVMDLPAAERPLHYEDLLKGSKMGDDRDASYFAQDIHTFYKGITKKIKEDEGRINYAKNDINSYLKYLQKLSLENKTDYRLFLTILNLYNTRTNIASEKLNPEEIKYFLSIADHAHSLSPRDPQVYWAVGYMKLWQGDAQGSLDDYTKAVEIDKTNKVSWIMMLNFAKTVEVKELYDGILKEAQKNIPNFKYENID